MAFGTIYTFPGDRPRTIAIKAVANANNLDFKIIEEPKSPAHFAVSKLGKVPAFVCEDGFELFECIAIAIYITSQNEETTLLGKTKRDYANILKWMSFFNSEIITPLVEKYLPLVGIRPYNKETVDMFANMAQAAVDVVEEHLDGKTFLVGEEISLADTFCAGIISLGFMFFYGKEWRQANPNVSRWFEHIISQPIYSAVTEKVEFLDEPKLTSVPPQAS
ncbi:glutathione S-transferase psoE [Aspergillus affinis]|uniref:glutathione S-transferase psoE n=1 Tax=Aspergillus affinis TaxID=1070780 RepID=UPI0022FE8BAA|nr:putative glutathione S-transferase [Aspergillus affinis]KAI9040690.1 putative glutathione S-transferase [Aspergillus affinis]